MPGRHQVTKRATSGSSSENDAPRQPRGRPLHGRVPASDSDRSSTPSPPKKINGKAAPNGRARAPLPLAVRTNGTRAPVPSDSSASSDAEPPARPRTPLRAVSLNEGRRESLETPTSRAKRRLSSRPSDLRRQSLNNAMHRAPNSAGSGPSNAKQSTVGTTLGKGPPPKVAALAATAARRHQARYSSGMFSTGLGGEGPSAPISREVMANNYEEWMKMATDNKINATNTWSFALIDYFHDMSLLRNTDDSSINFQKASCTLDGCVKIWTSRVDSVATETGKLLSGLAEDGTAAHEETEEGEERDEASDDDGAQRQKQRRAAKKADTLVDFDRLMVKKFDLEVSVDPLFKKTAADFDEGGASGILMNHLGCDANMRIIFDAGDARLDNGGGPADQEVEPEDDEVDLSQLRNTWLPDLNLIDELVICPSMASFKFSSDPNMLDLDLFRNNHSPTADDERDPLGRSGSDFFGDNDQHFMPEARGDDGDDYDAVNGFDVDDIQGGADFFADEPEAIAAGRTQHEREIVMAFAKDGDTQMFDYFDSALMKNWAGPEHWKLQRTLRRVAAEQDAAGAKAKRAPKEKVEFSIDFTTPSTISSKELFAAGTRASTMLAKSKRKANDDHTLPDDMHFSSQQLLRLFLKPNAVLNSRKRGKLAAPRMSEDQELDEHYWAEANAAQAMGPNDSAALDADVGMPVPFATQFFDSEGDFGPDYDDDLAMGDDVGALDGPTPLPLDGDTAPLDADSQLLAAMQTQARKVRPELVNYAKKAKRVDVRKLKENIWRELDIDIARNTPRAAGAEQTPDQLGPQSQDNAEPKSFNSVLSGLRRVYPQDKMEEISTSFCFICLLHLANEQGLRIGNVQSSTMLDGKDEDDDDVDVEQDVEPELYVGDLSALRIIKEQRAVTA